MIHSQLFEIVETYFLVRLDSYPAIRDEQKELLNMVILMQ